MVEDRLQNGDIFSFLRSFGGSLETLLDNSIPAKAKRREFTVAYSDVSSQLKVSDENSVRARDFAKA